MSGHAAQNEQAGKAESGTNRSDGGSWAVEYSEPDRSFTIRVLDYHAGPLKITLDELTRLAGMAAPAAAARAVDARQDPAPRLGVSLKEKSLYIAVPEGWSGLLRISRKDLYQFGKLMGKRSRRGRKRFSPGRE